MPILVRESGCHQGGSVTYDDGKVACTGHGLVIRRYYFPGGAKRIPYSQIRQVRQVTMKSLGWRIKIWGSGDLIHRFNLDVHRWHKDVALIILLPGRVRPVVTLIMRVDSRSLAPASTATLSRTEIKHIWERGHGAGRDPQTDERLCPHAG